MREFSKQTIFLISDQEPDNRWNNLKSSFNNIVYVQASLDDPEEISRTAIEDCSKVIFLNNL